MKIVLQNALRDIAEFYVRFIQNKCEYNKILAYIMSKAGKDSMNYTHIYETIFDLFEKTGMLKQVISNDDWDGSTNYIELCFGIFWSYYISKELIKNKHSRLTNENIIKDLEEYLSSINIRNINSELFQFYVLNKFYLKEFYR